MIKLRDNALNYMRTSDRTDDESLLDSSQIDRLRTLSAILRGEFDVYRDWNHGRVKEALHNFLNVRATFRAMPQTGAKGTGSPARAHVTT